jgi:glycosyltransferase involved in cell wall biosynthesis
MKGTPSRPRVSVIMPVRNEAAYIEGALDAVFAQDYPPDEIEVVVADGMSTDGTREKLESMRARHPNLRVVDNPLGIAPTALNAALRSARGEIVVRVDGHCEIAPDYVRRCVDHLESGAAEAVGGPVETVGVNALGEAIALAMSSRFGVGGSAFRTVKGRTLLVDTVPFPGYRREVLERVGPFDEELVRDQDDEYNYRLRKLGGRVLLAHDVRSRYYSRGSWRALWRQYFQYGYWKVRVLQKHPRQMKARQFVPALFVAALGGAAVLAPFLPGARWALVGTLGAYLLANLAASLSAAAGGGWRRAHLLPATFAILHVAYGSGFLTGLLRFWNRWGGRAAAPAEPLWPEPTRLSEARKS